MDGHVGLSLAEIGAGLIGFCQGNARDKLFVTFMAADENGDGTLDPTELRNFYKLRTQGSIISLLALSPFLPTSQELHQLFGDSNSLNHALQLEDKEFSMSDFVKQEDIEKRFSSSNKTWYTMLTH